MASLYLDTSALGRVLLGEPEAGAILTELARWERHVASRLVRTELRRVAIREGVLSAADRLLQAVALVPVDETMLTAAETIPPSTVGTLDAIHLATAVRLASAGALEAVMTYDARLADGVRHHGLTVVAPA